VSVPGEGSTSETSIRSHRESITIDASAEALYDLRHQAYR
jgi:hypothetical protein